VASRGIASASPMRAGIVPGGCGGKAKAPIREELEAGDAGRMGRQDR